jgi:tyrosine phenol-lyase
MEALAQGIRESTDERIVHAYVSQARHLGGLLEDAGVPIVLPVGAHAVFVDAKRFLPHLEQTELPAQTLAAAFYLAGGVRSMERGIVSGQHGSDPYDGLELVRLTLPRRVYTQEHLTWVADVVTQTLARASEIPGLRFTYEPEHLRFFQARFAPLSPFSDLAIEQAGEAPTLVPA